MYGLITLKELAQALEKSESTIRTWKRRGELPAEIFKEIGGTVYVREERFKNWLDSES